MKTTRLSQLWLLIAFASCSSPNGPSRETCVEGLLAEELGNSYNWTSDSERSRCQRRLFGEPDDGTLLGVDGRPLTVNNLSSGYVIAIIVDDQQYDGNPVLVMPGASWVVFVEDRPNSIKIIWSDGRVTQYSVSRDWEVML